MKRIKMTDNERIEKKRQRGRDYYAKHQEREREKHRKYSAEHRDEMRERNLKYRSEHLEEVRKSHRKSSAKVRQRVLSIVAHRDHPKCVRCGCDDIRFLEINHKNGGGGKESKLFYPNISSRISSGKRSIDDLEILCKACNAIHALELKYGKVALMVAWNPTEQLDNLGKFSHWIAP